MPTVLRATALTDPILGHGEGPVWHDGEFRCVDMLAGDVVTLAGDGSVRRDHVGDVAAALRPRRSGGWVVATEREFVLLDAAFRPEWSSGPLWSEDDIRFNEGGADPDGAFLCGSMAYDERTGAGTLYRLRPDRTVEVVEEGLTIPNGLAFADDGTALHVDTPTHRIDRITLRDGRTAERRPVVTIEDGVGHPDGLTPDAAGGFWVALFTGGAVRHYTADGVLDAVVEVPASQTTACALGGTRLYVTTSARDIDPDDEPLAGAVFVAEVGDVAAPGVPVRPYAG